MTLKKGWLERQSKIAEQDIAQWPDWMRREAGLPPKRFVKHTIEVDIPAGQDPLMYLREALDAAISHNYELLMSDLTKTPPINKESLKAAAEIYRGNINEYRRVGKSLNLIA